MPNFLCALAGLSLFLIASAEAQTPVTLTVEAMGALPGFNITGATPYLAATMGEAGVSSWRFAPHDSLAAAPDRIEWHFTVLPYAGGEVRRFFPRSEAENGVDVHIQGVHRLISAEVVLYLGGEYQTKVLGQEAVQGGAGDPDLKAFVVAMTRLLDNGYRAIDMSPATPLKPAP